VEWDDTDLDWKHFAVGSLELVTNIWLA